MSAALARRRLPLGRVATWLVLCALLTGCYLPSAVRRSARIVEGGCDRDRWGSYVVLTGPGSVLLAAGDLAVHAFVPLDYDGYFLVDRREPDRQWFRFYPGPMQPLDQVGILCKGDHGIHVETIRRMTDPARSEARYEKWHFPECVEVMPGVYELTVGYFARKTYNREEAMVTYNVESTAPARIAWNAEAGGRYVMYAVLGKRDPAPGTHPPGSTIRTIPRSKTQLGTSTFNLDVAKWTVRIERVADWRQLEVPVLDVRARWEQYERRH